MHDGSLLQNVTVGIPWNSKKFHQDFTSFTPTKWKTFFLDFFFVFHRKLEECYLLSTKHQLFDTHQISSLK